jgi:hypothetical protein
MIAIPLDNVKKIISMNNKGKMPDKLEDLSMKKEKKSDFQNAADHFQVDRFDEE